MRDQEAAAEHPLQFVIALECISGRAPAPHAVGNIAERDRPMADCSDDLTLGPEVIQGLRHVLIRVEVEGRASTAGDMNSVIRVKVYVPQLQGRIELCDKASVRKEALADEIVRLGGMLEIGVAVGIVDDLAAGRAREVNLDASLGEVPVGMGHLRKPKGSVGVRDNEQD